MHTLPGANLLSLYSQVKQKDLVGPSLLRTPILKLRWRAALLSTFLPTGPSVSASINLLGVTVSALATGFMTALHLKRTLKLANFRIDGYLNILYKQYFALLLGRFFGFDFI